METPRRRYSTPEEIKSRVKAGDESIVSEIGLDLIGYYGYNPTFIHNILQQYHKENPLFLSDMINFLEFKVREVRWISGFDTEMNERVTIVEAPGGLYEMLLAIIESNIASFEEIYDMALYVAYERENRKFMFWLDSIIDGQV